MAKNNNKPVDIVKSGPQTYRDLQKENALQYQNAAGASSLAQKMNFKRNYAPSTSYIYEGPERSPLQQDDYSDYLDASHWDNPSVNEEDYQNNLGDLRAENQPWYSKIINGIGKAGVLAVTTAAETGGLVYGIGQGIYNAANAEDGDGLGEFVHGIWDNPITQALKNINDNAEKLMPNYYTRDEQENPLALRNIFSANTLGDKLLKNTGFMVGAFYGGIPAAAALGKAGTALVKSARTSALAKAAGEGQRVAEAAAKFGDDIAAYNKWLNLNKLTSADRAANYAKSLDKIRTMAGATRATTQTIGALGSAINEGAIEAINNSEDWAKLQRQKVEDKYRSELQAVERRYKGTEMEVPAKIAVRQEYEKALNEVERNKVKMGNADLLLNIPILTATNAFELGKLYARGFNSTRMRMGNALSPHSMGTLPGSLKKGTLKSSMSRKKGILVAGAKSLSEGAEEYLQRAASDGPGSALEQGIDRYIETGKSEQSKVDANDYILSFGKAIADNLGDESAWDEFFVGFGSSLIGMPVFGSQTRNAYVGKNGPVGLAGGIVGNYNDYAEKMKTQNDVTNYINQRVQDPKFKKLYETLRKTGDYDKLMEDALNEDDKKKYKDLEFEKMFEDIYAAAVTGHLDELKELIGYNKEYDEKELHDIMMETSQLVTAKEQKQRDEEQAKQLQSLLDWYNSASEEDQQSFNFDIKEVEEELKNTNARIAANDYIDKREGGPFINVNGEMDTQVDENGEKGGEMRRILERNKNHLLDSIDNIERIRNAIDIETDGRLSPENLKFLTQMRAKMWDMDNRSTEMASNVIDSVKDIAQSHENWRERIDDNYNKVKKAHDNAVRNLEEAKKAKKNTSKEEKEVRNTEEALLKAKRDKTAITNVMSLLEALGEQRSTTASERAAYAKGYGSEPNSRIQGAIGRIIARTQLGDRRNLNADEVQALFKDKEIEGAFIHAIRKSDLDAKKKEELERDVRDLGDLARDKMEYNTQLRKFMGDPSLINEAFKNSADKVSKKELDNKTNELALSIRNAKNFTELNNLLKDAYNVNREMTQNAMKKAKEGADEETKNFLNNYERGSELFSNFMKQLRNYPNDVSAGVSVTASNAWEYALTSNDGRPLYDKLLDNLKESAKLLRENGNPIDKAEADSIDKILSDLNAASSATTTSNKSKNTPKSTSTPAKGKSKFNGSLLAEGAERKPAKNAPITKEDLKDAIEDEIRSGMDKNRVFKIDSLDKLSKKLKDKIETYNKNNPEDKIDEEFFDSIIGPLVEEAFADDTTIPNRTDDKNIDRDGLEKEASTLSESMSKETKEAYKSDYVSEYEYYLDYRKEYDPRYVPNGKQLARVQKLLKDSNAYQFVDNNLLGYVSNAYKGDLPLYFLKSTDTEINQGKDDKGNTINNPVIFVAIKLDREAKNAIRAKVGEYTAKTYKIDGEEYQILGVASINALKSNTVQEVRDAFSSFQIAINKELDEKIEKISDEDKQSTPFVKSDRLSTTLKTIFTGRLERREDENSGDEKITIKEFLTSSNSEKGRVASAEWASGNVPIFFGIVVGNKMAYQESINNKGTIVNPNSRWLNDKKNSGAILMYVPKPDGKMYPLVCIRRTVGDWLKDKGEDMLTAALNGESNSNEYIKNITDLFYILLNPSKEWSERMQAKQDLSRYFLFGKRGAHNQPFYFTDDGVFFKPYPNSNGIRLNGNDNSEKIMHFFRLAADANIAFSLSAKDGISARDIINANILETNVRGFYNFNASFTMEPIDGEGHTVTANYTGPTTVRPSKPNRTEFSIFYEGENHTYYIDGDKIYYDSNSGKEVEDKRELTFIRAARDAEAEQLPRILTTKAVLTNRAAKFKEDFANSTTKYNEIYIFTVDGKTWIYDKRQATKGEEKIFEITSGKGKALRRSIQEDAREYQRKSNEDKKIADTLKEKNKEQQGKLIESKEEKEAKRVLIQGVIDFYNKAGSPRSKDDIKAMENNATTMPLSSFMKEGYVGIVYSKDLDLRAKVEGILNKNASASNKENTTPKASVLNNSRKETTDKALEGLSSTCTFIVENPIDKLEQINGESSPLIAAVAEVQEKKWMKDIYNVMQESFKSGRRPSSEGCPTEDEIAEAIRNMKGQDRQKRAALKSELITKIKGCKP